MKNNMETIILSFRIVFKSLVWYWMAERFLFVGDKDGVSFGVDFGVAVEGHVFERSGLLFGVDELPLWEGVFECFVYIHVVVKLKEYDGFVIEGCVCDSFWEKDWLFR